MDLVARLAAQARQMLQFEKDSRVSFEAARMTTRQMLREDAALMCIPEPEIEAAVDAALGGK